MKTTEKKALALFNAIMKARSTQFTVAAALGSGRAPKSQDFTSQDYDATERATAFVDYVGDALDVMAGSEPHPEGPNRAQALALFETILAKGTHARTALAVKLGESAVLTEAGNLEEKEQVFEVLSWLVDSLRSLVQNRAIQSSLPLETNEEVPEPKSSAKAEPVSKDELGEKLRGGKPLGKASKKKSTRRPKAEATS